MLEPDWTILPLDQLIVAEKMALHRVSGGESSWKLILGRIREAKEKAEKIVRREARKARNQK